MLKALAEEVVHAISANETTENKTRARRSPDREEAPTGGGGRGFFFLHAKGGGA